MAMLESQYGYFLKINEQGSYILENKNIERQYNGQFFDQNDLNIKKKNLIFLNKIVLDTIQGFEFE